MGIRSRYAKLVPIAAISIVLQGLCVGVEAADRCERVVGEWAWFIGGTVTFSPPALVRWVPDNKAIPPAVGAWVCTPDTGKVQVTWQNGFVDTLEMAGDGQALSGISSTGVPVSGRRVASASVESATTPAKPAPAADKSADGWTPIGKGGMGKQSTVPIEGGVPRPIGPQGRPPPKGAG